MPPQRVIVQTYAGKYAVGDAGLRRRGGNEGPDLRQQTDQRDLSEIDRLPRHIRRGQQHDLWSGTDFSLPDARILGGQTKVCPTKPRVVRRETALGLIAS